MADAGGPVVVAVDQGTSSTKALALDRTGAGVAWSTVPIGQAHPRAGWVEQDPEEIAASAVSAIQEVLGGIADRVVAVGLSNQRESAVLWERSTGRALGPVLGWQDRRTADEARRLAPAGERIRAVSGLPLDPMFSALKFGWLLDQVDPDRRRAEAGELVLGTVDAWLVHRLTGDERIEAGNASRTQLLDLDAVDWSDELLRLFRIPRAALPRIAASNEPTSPVRGIAALAPTVAIRGVLGDSHAALYGHGVREPGAVKVTLGTGASVMGLTDGPVPGPALARTIAWSDARPHTAFEGNISAAGATLVWLGGLLGMEPADVVTLGLAAPESAVDLVPAFAGLGAPWWDGDAQAVLTGFDLGTDRAAVARAAVESIALQIEDVLKAADAVTGTRIDTVHADGGPAGNDALVQVLADLTGRTVRRPDVPGLSAVGAAHLAGIGAGLWSAAEALDFDRRADDFVPALPPDQAERRRERWRLAVDRARLSHRPRS